MKIRDVNGKVNEGWYNTRPIDRERYNERPGLEGPFQTKVGKVVYYDPKEGAYYDPDSDIYMTYDEWKALDESLPPHLAKFVGDDGDFTPDAKARLGKDGERRLLTKKVGTIGKDVTPKGYGPMDEAVGDDFVKVDKRVFHGLEGQGAVFNYSTGGLYMNGKLVGYRDNAGDDGDRRYYDYFVAPSFTPAMAEQGQTAPLAEADSVHATYLLSMMKPDYKNRANDDMKYIKMDFMVPSWGVAHPQALRKQIDENPHVQELRQQGYANLKTIAAWKGDLDSELADAHDKLNSDKQWIASYKQDLEKKVDTLSQAKKIMGSSEILEGVREARDPMDVINKFLDKKKSREARSADLAKNPQKVNQLKSDEELQEEQESFKSVVKQALADIRAFMASEPVGFDDAEHLASEWFAQHPGGHGDWNKLSPETQNTWTQLAHIAMHGAPDEHVLDEGMPSSVIKHKQKYAEMSDQELAAKLAGKSETELRQMAWRHGYGKMSDHYVRRVAKGSVSEDVGKLTQNTYDKYYNEIIAAFKEENPRIRLSGIGWAKNGNIAIKDMNGDEWEYNPIYKKLKLMSETNLGETGRYQHPDARGGFTGFLDFASENLASKAAIDELVQLKLDKQLMKDYKYYVVDNQRGNVLSKKKMDYIRNAITKEVKARGLVEAGIAEAKPTDSDYAIGMSQAMKSTGDKKPLKKSTITKGHKIAKAVAREAEQLDEYKPGVTTLTRELSFADTAGTQFDIHDPDAEYATIKKIRWPYGIDVSFNDRTRTVRFKTAKMKTVAKILDKHIDFGAISAAEALDLPPEMMGEAPKFAFPPLNRIGKDRAVSKKLDINIDSGNDLPSSEGKKYMTMGGGKGMRFWDKDGKLIGSYREPHWKTMGDLMKWATANGWRETDDERPGYGQVFVRGKIPKEIVGEAMPTTGTKVVITMKGNPVRELQVQRDAKPHHIVQELRKVPLGLSEVELMKAARDLAAGKIYRNGVIAMQAQGTTPREMR